MSVSSELESLIAEDKRLKEELLQLELQIYGLEQTYLQSTAQVGNLVRGWGDLLTSKPTSKKKYKITDDDRIFSQSSATALRSVQNNSKKKQN